MALDRSQRRLIREIEVGGGRSLAWSPDGRLFAIAGRESEVSVWTREGRRLWRHADGRGSWAIAYVAWSPDGRRLAAHGQDHEFVIWDAATGNRHVSIGATTAWGGGAWSPDGLVFASGSDSGLQLWSTSTWSQVARMTDSQSTGVKCVAFAPDGRLLASGHADGEVRLWNSDGGHLRQNLSDDAGRASAVYSLAWSPDGRRIAYVDGASRVQVRGLANAETLTIGDGFSGGPIVWSADGRRLTGPTGDRPLRFWDAETGAEVAVVGEPGAACRCVSLSAVTLASVSDDGVVALWDVSDLVGRPETRLGGVAARAWLARQAATVGRRASVVAAPRPWAPETLPRDDTPGLLGMLADEETGVGSAMALSPDGRSIATDFGSGESRGLCCWDVASGALRWRHAGTHSNTIWSLAWSPDGRRLGSASEDRTIGLWDAATGAILHRLTDTGDATSVVWSPDGQLLASAGGNGPNLRLWDGRTGAEGARYESHGLWSVAWSPDGAKLAHGFESLIVSNAGDGSTRMETAVDSIVYQFAWSPDGACIAAGLNDNSVRIWRAANGAELQRFEGHADKVQDVAWSPDGRYLASGGLDHTVRVWDVTKGTEVANFVGKGPCWRSLGWSPGGAFIASSHHSDAVRLWDTRFLLESTHAAPVPSPAVASTVPPELRPLPAALATLHLLDIHPAVSVVRDLRDALGAAEAAADPDPLASLRALPSLRRLRDLRWPAPARTGLVALLLRGLPAGEWAPPADLPSDRVTEMLTEALRGEPMAPEAPPAPLGFLTSTADRVDGRLLTLLAALGPEAVAADPGLPLRLLPEVGRLPLLTDAARRLLTTRIVALDTGAAQGDSAGVEPAGIGPRGRITQVLASQFALPPPLFAYRARDGGLLYRTRAGRAPPRLRPAVLVLDVSPAAFGPVEAMTRPAAHAVAATLRAAGLEVALVTAGGKGTARLADSPAAALAALTERSLAMADAAAAMAKAESLRRTLGGEGAAPFVLLLAHPWFGAEEPGAMAPAGLRALFVQYPGQAVRPAWADRCERFESLPHTAWTRLPDALGRLIG